MVEFCITLVQYIINSLFFCFSLYLWLSEYKSYEVGNIFENILLFLIFNPLQKDLERRKSKPVLPLKYGLVKPFLQLCFLQFRKYFVQLMTTVLHYFLPLVSLPRMVNQVIIIYILSYIYF